MRKITKLVFHHTVTPDNWTGYYGDGLETYHWVIYKDGKSKRVYPDSQILWHAGNYQVNKESVGIAFVGNYSTNKPSKKALDKAYSLVKLYKKRYKIKGIYGHKEIVPTRCPGDWWRKGFFNYKKEKPMKLTDFWKYVRPSMEWLGWRTKLNTVKGWTVGQWFKHLPKWSKEKRGYINNLKERVEILDKQVEGLATENNKLNKRLELCNKKFEKLTLWEKFQLLFNKEK